MSHPQNFFEGCKDFQSLIARCPHSVFRVWDDPAGKSSVCEICNSETEREVGAVRRPLTEKQLMKATRQIEKVVPPIAEDPEINETASAEIDEESFEEDPRELGESAETDFEIEEEPQAERETADVEG